MRRANSLIDRFFDLLPVFMVPIASSMAAVVIHFLVADVLNAIDTRHAYYTTEGGRLIVAYSGALAGILGKRIYKGARR